MEWSMFTKCLTVCARYLHNGTNLSRQVTYDEDCSRTPFFRSRLWHSARGETDLFSIKGGARISLLISNEITELPFAGTD
jgi:hypothetical protein